MQDIWYSDNRDLIKWGTLFNLAEKFEASQILHVAYFRPGAFEELVIDGKPRSIPGQVLSHFRDIKAIEGIKSSKVQVKVFSEVFQDRTVYQSAVLKFLQASAAGPASSTCSTRKCGQSGTRSSPGMSWAAISTPTGAGSRGSSRNKNSWPMRWASPARRSR